MQRVDKIDSISAKLMLLEAYETMYQIYNHEAEQLNERGDPIRPLALVAMHSKENDTNYSSMHRLIARYALHDIGDKFKLSLTEFLDLPHEITDLLFRIASDKIIAGGKEADKIVKSLGLGR